MSPKFGVRNDTEVKNTAKYYSQKIQETGQGKDDKKNLIRGQVNRAGKTQKLGQLCTYITFFI